MPEYTFQRFAGTRQVRIRSYEELTAIKHLPEAHWVATACPTQGLACDPRFLELIDADQNGRVRANELIEAIAFTEKMIAVPENMVPGKSTLELSHLSDHAGELKATALRILENLGSHERARITLDDVRRTKEIFDKAATNGDGIISPSVFTEDPALAKLIEEILSVLPGVKDISGELGVDLATLDRFEEDRASALEWNKRGAAREQQAIAALVAEVTPKLDEYFLECRLIASQPEAEAALKLNEDEVHASVGDAVQLKKALNVLPIAPRDPNGVLAFDLLYRGATYEKLVELHEKAVGADTLSEKRWNGIKAEQEPLNGWRREEASHPILKLGVERLEAIEKKDLDQIRAACRRDLEIGKTLVRVGELERLILYQRWIFAFANNFVSMPYLFDPNERAMFEQGTLIMSGREFSLAIRIQDRAAHSMIAADAGMYIMYVEVYGGRPEVRYEVAVPVTAGTSNNLWVGKNGIFRSIDGNEYDAKIVQLVTQPVSIWEALTQPFTKLGAFLTKRFERLSKKLDDDLDRMNKPAAAPVPVPAQTVGSAGIGGVLVSGSVAFAAVGSALAFITTQIQKMLEDPLTLVYALLVVIAILFGPIALFSWLRLRSRNLAIVLEGAGWALNDRLRLTAKLGRLYSRRPRVPTGSRVSRRDQLRRSAVA